MGEGATGHVGGRQLSLRRESGLYRLGVDMLRPREQGGDAERGSRPR